MIQPIRMANSTKAMNPPIRGQNMAKNVTGVGGGASGEPASRSGVKRDLLGRRGELPGHLEAALLAEHESQLAGRAQALRMRGTKRRARARFADRTQPVAHEVAVLAPRGARDGSSVGHARRPPCFRASLTVIASDPDTLSPHPRTRFPEIAGFFDFPAHCRFFCGVGEIALQFP
jgi:hypothetical protein